MVEKSTHVDRPGESVLVDDPVGASYIELGDAQEFITDFRRRHGGGKIWGR